MEKEVFINPSTHYNYMVVRVTQFDTASVSTSVRHEIKKPGSIRKFFGKMKDAASRHWKKAALATIPFTLGACLAQDLEKNPCKSYNETTISLNRETDGRIATLVELEKPAAEGELISEAVIDFVNETHALSTEGMPNNALLTLVESSCMVNSAAYVFGESRTSDLGIYIPHPINFNPYVSTPCVDIILLDHELGHMQPYGGGHETITHVNELEQNLMGYVLFHNQGDRDLDSIRWAFLYRELATTLYRNPPSKSHEFDIYSRSRIFVAFKIIEFDGDMAAVRADIIRLVQNEMLNSEIESCVSSYVSGLPPGDSVAEANRVSRLQLQLQISLFNEVKRRFGNDAALSFFNAKSHVLNGLHEVISMGLEGMNCANFDRLSFEDFPALGRSDKCMLEDMPEIRVASRTNNLHEIPEGTRLVCAIPEGDLELVMYVVGVSGYKCSGTYIFNDNYYGSVNVMDIRSLHRIY